MPGLATAVAPTAAFVVANAVGGLTAALIVLAVTVPAVFAVRIARRESLRAAAGGVAVAALYALVAAVTGEARGFFLVPTLMPAALAVICLATVVAGHPVTGLLFNRTVGGPTDWPRHPRLRRVHTVSTLAATLVNAVNFLAQAVFYLADRPVALAVAHVAIWPVFATLVAATLAAARRTVTTGAGRPPRDVGPFADRRAGRRFRSGG